MFTENVAGSRNDDLSQRGITHTVGSEHSFFSFFFFFSWCWFRCERWREKDLCVLICFGFSQLRAGASVAAGCSCRLGDISKPPPASKCYFIVCSHAASPKPRDPNWQVRVHATARVWRRQKKLLMVVFQGKHSRNKSSRCKWNRGKRKTSEKAPCAPKNNWAKSNLSEQWNNQHHESGVNFVDACAVHPSERCRGKKRSPAKPLWSPFFFYEAETLLSESQYALCWRELFPL